MRPTLKNVMAIAASASLFASTTGIAASPPPAQQPAAVQPQAPNAWVMLSALSPSTRSIVQDGAVTAAQPGSLPQDDRAAARVRGELLPFLLWFGLIAVALSIAGSSGANAAPGPTPNSPS